MGRGGKKSTGRKRKKQLRKVKEQLENGTTKSAKTEEKPLDEGSKQADEGPHDDYTLIGEGEKWTITLFLRKQKPEGYYNSYRMEVQVTPDAKGPGAPDGEDAQAAPDGEEAQAAPDGEEAQAAPDAKGPGSPDGEEAQAAPDAKGPGAPDGEEVQVTPDAKGPGAPDGEKGQKKEVWSNLVSNVTDDISKEIAAEFVKMQKERWKKGEFGPW